MSGRAPWASVAAIVVAVGCEDSGKISEQKAAEAVAKLVPIVASDVAQLRRGLPLAAAKIGPVLDPDPGVNLPGLQTSIKQARASVHDLDVSKITFLSFADPSGIVLRSEADPDLLASRSVLATFPTLHKAVEHGAGVVEAFGEMQEMRGVRTGPDQQWVLAHAVRNPAGEVKGMFVAGWSFRLYARYLEDAGKRDLMQIARDKNEKTPPLLYVFVVKGPKAYGAPVTPDLNAEAVEKLDVVGKSASGPMRAVVELSGRTFGVAAQRSPDLGDDVAIAAMMSEI